MKTILMLLAAVVFVLSLCFLGFGYVWYGVTMFLIAIIFTMGFVLMDKEEERITLINHVVEQQQRNMRPIIRVRV